MNTQDFKEDKFKELVLHIARRCESDPTFGAIKLNKVLFLSDFSAYMELGQSITGAEYIKLKHGPAPRLMAAIRDAMEKQNDIVVVQRERFGYQQSRVIPRRDADLSSFMATEIALVDIVMDAVKEANATSLSDMTHHILGWKIADLKTVIPYEAAFLSEAPATPEDQRRARELAGKYNW